MAIQDGSFERVKRLDDFNTATVDTEGLVMDKEAAGAATSTAAATVAEIIRVHGGRGRSQRMRRRQAADGQESARTGWLQPSYTRGKAFDEATEAVMAVSHRIHIKGELELHL